MKRNPFCRCGHEFMAHYTVHVECVGAACGPKCHDRCVGKDCQCRSFSLALRAEAPSEGKETTRGE